MKTLLAILIAASALLAACASSGEYQSLDDGPTALFNNTKWNLVRLGNQSIPTSAHINIAFDPEGRATGHAGVNAFFSQTTTGQDNALTFGPVGATKKAGPPEQMQRESDFLKALADTRAFRMTGEHLDLLDASGNPLAHFNRNVALPLD